MATVEFKIVPLVVPDYVSVDVPGSDSYVDISIADLPQETLLSLVEDFTTALLAKAGVPLEG